MRFWTQMMKTWSWLKRNPRAWALLVLLVILFSGFSLLRLYTVELVHTIVVEALIQKAPPTFPSQSVYEAFDQARLEANRANASEAYLERLFQISLRLEKTQQLTEGEVADLVGAIRSSKWQDP